MELHGADGKAEFHLNETAALSVYKNLFEKGQVDLFHFHEKSEPIGRLAKLVIGHDGQGMGADWLVEYVKVVVNDSHSYTFSINKIITTEKQEFAPEA